MFVLLEKMKLKRFPKKIRASQARGRKISLKLNLIVFLLQIFKGKLRS